VLQEGAEFPQRSDEADLLPKMSPLRDSLKKEQNGPNRPVLKIIPAPS
jgi:hypothetical protein